MQVSVLLGGRVCAVETCEAGEGCVEIEVFGPSGRAIPHTVTSMGPNLANVSFLPTECGLHHACVTFNKEPIPGMLFLSADLCQCYLGAFLAAVHPYWESP